MCAKPHLPVRPREQQPLGGTLLLLSVLLAANVLELHCRYVHWTDQTTAHERFVIAAQAAVSVTLVSLLVAGVVSRVRDRPDGERADGPRVTVEDPVARDRKSHPGLWRTRF